VSGHDVAGSSLSATTLHAVGVDTTTATISLHSIVITTVDQHKTVGEQVTVSGTVGGDVAAVKDTVTLTNVTLADGSHPTAAVQLLSDGKTLGFSVLVPVDNLPRVASTGDFIPVNASVTHTDLAGSTATANSVATPSFDVTSVNINLNPIAITLDNGSLVPTTTVNGTVGGDAVVGDHVTLTNVTLADGTHPTASVVLLGDGVTLGFSVADVPVIHLPGWGSGIVAVVASLTHTDAAGSTDTVITNSLPFLDTLIHASTGDAVLTGGFGVDTFVWSLADHGTVAVPVVDHITNFSVTKGDMLDLRDLLQGEHNGTAAGAPSNLGSFLSFSLDHGHLELLVNNDPAHNASATQTIIFDSISGADVNTARDALAGQLGITLAAGTHASDSDLLKKLVDTGHLLTNA